ncbi:MAG: 4-hydroxy-tetrahydrodipicolinate synthase [Bdellovibrionota bacterium]
MISLPEKFLRGSYPPLVTPFKNGKVDYDRYVKLCDYQIANGTHGILVSGTTGEPSALTVEERAKLVEVAVQAAKKKVPIVAATGCESWAGTLELTQKAEKAGADALLVVTPYYIKPPQRGLVEYYVALGKETKLPLMIYHIPGRAAVGVTVETVEKIAAKAPHLVGIKHAVNDLDFVSELIAKMGEGFRIFCGLESLSFPMMALGAAGLMNAVGNIAAKKVADLCEAVWRGDLPGAKKLHYELYELNQAVFLDTNPIPMKYMMKKMGLLESAEHRLPMLSVTDEQAKKLDAVLQRAGLMK